MLIIHRDKLEIETGSIHQKIADCLRTRFEYERVKYERELNSLDEIVNEKLTIGYGKSKADKIDQILLYRDVAMNNLWVYIMTSGYVVPFIDNATSDSTAADLYGTSLAYDETCEKLIDIKELCSDIGFKL